MMCKSDSAIAGKSVYKCICMFTRWCACVWACVRNLYIFLIKKITRVRCQYIGKKIGITGKLLVCIGLYY